MLTRRKLLITTTMGGLLLAAGPAAWSPAYAQGADATAFILKLGTDLSAIVNSAGDYEGKKRRLQPLIETAVDIDGVGRFCLGRYWRTATPAQQSEYLRLFHDVLVNNIGGKIGEFQGVTFKPTTTTQRDGNAVVGTLISRPNQQPNNVQWVVSSASGAPKVIDVIAEGTSLRITQASDYAAYISRNNGNVDALIAAMKAQVSR